MDRSGDNLGFLPPTTVGRDQSLTGDMNALAFCGLGEQTLNQETRIMSSLPMMGTDMTALEPLGLRGGGLPREVCKQPMQDV